MTKVPVRTRPLTLDEATRTLTKMLRRHGTTSITLASVRTPYVSHRYLAELTPGPATRPGRGPTRLTAVMDLVSAATGWLSAGPARIALDALKTNDSDRAKAKAKREAKLVLDLVALEKEWRDRFDPASDEDTAESEAAIARRDRRRDAAAHAVAQKRSGR